MVREKLGKYVVDGTPISCGADWLYDLHSTPAGGLKSLAMQGYGKNGTYDDPAPAFFIFSDTKSGGNGVALAEYIEEHSLGTVVESPWKRNPNSGNMIRVWIWAPNKKRFQTHMNGLLTKEEKQKRDDNYNDYY